MLVVEDKFTILKKNIDFLQDALCSSLLRDLMSVIMSNCTRMASNEFANYVVQHIIQTPPLAEYRDAIIDQCLL